ncbi:type II toxin-antitoxin system RelE/ParE family toxin [Limosilactobacillus caecicola]|uniref:type II toxin-antitoxin system RelE/ParE family toxin n=1 Tax=Limosilactobacillus caecicola TaxID=2941332 RepID=UPI00203B5055|nr:type II toxin-antitoxin system RelE/ParE family toxin [Limosilactobacillus caecicola]
MIFFGIKYQLSKWTKKLEDNLYEIRSKLASNIQQAIYFHWDGNQYIITHGFTKKTNKTPRREIRTGRRRRDDYERSHSRE